MKTRARIRFVTVWVANAIAASVDLHQAGLLTQAPGGAPTANDQSVRRAFIDLN